MNLLHYLDDVDILTILMERIHYDIPNRIKNKKINKNLNTSILLQYFLRQNV